MPWKTGFELLGLAAVLACGSAAFPPTRSADRGSFYVMSPHFTYKKAVDSVLDIDFRNAQLDIFENNGKLRLAAKLNKGIWQGHGTGNSGSLVLEDVRYFNFQAGMPQYALLMARWLPENRSQAGYGVVVVFGVMAHRLEAVQQVVFDAANGQAGAGYDTTGGRLIVRASHYTIYDLPCCPSKLDEVVFAWTGAAFEQESVRTLVIRQSGLKH